ncbi:MAG: hypothetical protein WCX71_05720 [Candidatus Buchananbacteria bacterium]|jgi:hypothetical protein
MILKESIIIKEEISAKLETVTYIIFYKEFCKNYSFIKTEKSSMILSGLFLHLAFESLVSYYIRLFINTAYSHKEEGIKTLWTNVFELGKFDKKMTFLKDTLIKSDPQALKDLNKISSFYRGKLSPFRNKVVHGHEISETTSSTGFFAKSKLAELVSEANIILMHKEFLVCVNIFLNLFNKAIVPDGINLSQNFIKDDMIVKPIKGLEDIYNNSIYGKS